MAVCFVSLAAYDIHFDVGFCLLPLSADSNNNVSSVGGNREISKGEKGRMKNCFHFAIVPY